MHSARNRRMKELVLKEKFAGLRCKGGLGTAQRFSGYMPVPDVPFPRVNDSKQMQRNYLFLQVYGVGDVDFICWCLGNCNPFALAVEMRDSRRKYQVPGGGGQCINNSSILNDKCETFAWPMSLVRIHNDGHESLGSDHLFAIVFAERAQFPA
jgi:hypothetical protein